MTTYAIEIGTLTLTAEREHTQYFECAAWHRTTVVPPGTYPVRAYVGWSNGGLRVHSVSAEATGVVKSASFQALWAGNPISNRDRGREEVGKTHTAHLSLMEYWRGEAEGISFELTHSGVTVESWTCSDGSRMSHLVVAPGYRVLCSAHGASGATCPAMLVPKEGELPRAVQIAAAAVAVERAKKASGYHEKTHECQQDACEVWKVLTHADVRARFAAAMSKAGVFAGVFASSAPWAVAS